MKKLFRKKDSGRNLIIFFILLLSIPVTLLLVRTFQSLLSKAEVAQAEFVFVPTSTNLPPNKTIDMWINAPTNHIAFVKAEIDFDPQLIQLSGEIEVLPAYSNIVVKSTKDQANASGKIDITLTSSTQDRDNNTIPIGLYDVLKLPFQAVSTAANQVAVVTVNLQNSQMVDLSGVALTIGVKNPSTFNINVTPTQSVTTPTPTLTSNAVGMRITGYPTSQPVNTDFTSRITMNTNANPVVGTDLVVTYNPTVLSLKGVVTSTFSQKHNEIIDNTLGKYMVTLSVATGESPIVSSSFDPVVLTFTAKAGGTSPITISPETVVAGTGTSGQNLVVVSTNGSVIVVTRSSTLAATVTPTLRPTATLTPVPSNTPTLLPTATLTPVPSNTPTTRPTNTPTPPPSPTPTLAPSATATPIPTNTPTPRPTATSTPRPTNTPVPLQAADIDQDGRVDISDYTLLLQYYGQRNPTLTRVDINRDGVVNIRDYAILYDTFGF